MSPLGPERAITDLAYPCLPSELTRNLQDTVWPVPLCLDAASEARKEDVVPKEAMIWGHVFSAGR